MASMSSPTASALPSPPPCRFEAPCSSIRIASSGTPATTVQRKQANPQRGAGRGETWRTPVSGATKGVTDHLRRHLFWLRLADGSGGGEPAGPSQLRRDERPRKGGSDRAHRHGCVWGGAAERGGDSRRVEAVNRVTCPVWKNPAEIGDDTRLSAESHECCTLTTTCFF